MTFELVEGKATTSSLRLCNSGCLHTLRTASSGKLGPVSHRGVCFCTLIPPFSVCDVGCDGTRVL